jgi:hypothetical protein
MSFFRDRFGGFAAAGIVSRDRQLFGVSEEFEPSEDVGVLVLVSILIVLTSLLVSTLH